MTHKDLLRHLRRLGACESAQTWAATRSSAEAVWSECERGDWLLWLAARAGVDRRLVVLACCAVARTALRHVREGETRPLEAIETAERLARGEAGVTLADMRVYADAANAADAAAYAAAADYAAADAAAAAADYADDAWSRTRRAALQSSAALVRERISWAVVADALATEVRS